MKNEQMNADEDKKVAFESCEPQWHVSEEHLVWQDEPSMSCPDTLYYTATIKNGAYTLEDIASGLVAAAGSDDEHEPHWDVCRHRVYRFPDGVCGQPQLIATLAEVGADWAADAEFGRPRNKETRRLLNRGCTHPADCCLTREERAEAAK